MSYPGAGEQQQPYNSAIHNRNADPGCSTPLKRGDIVIALGWHKPWAEIPSETNVPTFAVVRERGGRVMLMTTACKTFWAPRANWVKIDDDGDRLAEALELNRLILSSGIGTSMEAVIEDDTPE